MHVCVYWTFNIITTDCTVISQHQYMLNAKLLNHILRNLKSATNMWLSPKPNKMSDICKLWCVMAMYHIRWHKYIKTSAQGLTICQCILWLFCPTVTYHS